MKERMEYVSDLHRAGVAEEALLSKLYCRFMSDVTAEEGAWMARHVLEQIRQFDEMEQYMKELSGGSAEERSSVLGEDIIRRMDGFVTTSQCRKLHSIRQAMDVLEGLFRGTCTLEETAAVIPAGYRGNTGERGRNGELLKVVEALFVPLEKTELQREAAEVVGMLRQDWMDDALFRAVLTLSLYTLMAGGAWDSDLVDLPVSVEYVSVAVCTLVSARETDAAVKMFLLSGFLAAGTATVMFLGSAAVIYAAYFLTLRTAGELVVSVKE